MFVCESYTYQVSLFYARKNRTKYFLKATKKKKKRLTKSCFANAVIIKKHN